VDSLDNFGIFLLVMIRVYISILSVDANIYASMSSLQNLYYNYKTSRSAVEMTCSNDTLSLETLSSRCKGIVVSIPPIQHSIEVKEYETY